MKKGGRSLWKRRFQDRSIVLRLSIQSNRHPIRQQATTSQYALKKIAGEESKQKNRLRYASFCTSMETSFMWLVNGITQSKVYLHLTRYGLQLKINSSFFVMFPLWTGGVGTKFLSSLTSSFPAAIPAPARIPGCCC